MIFVGHQAVEIKPSKEAIRNRIFELVEQDPGLAARLMRLQEFSHGVRTAEVFVTNACNLRCKGCWFFGHDMDKHGGEIRDLGEVRSFAQRLAESGITHVLLIGGEPTLAPDRITAFVDQMKYVTVVTNGTHPLPLKGFENINIAVSLWGGGPMDDQLRGIRPNGSTFTGLFDMARRAYRDDPRVVWIYTVCESGIDYIEDTVRAIADNGNQLHFGFYSAYGTNDPVGLAERQRLIDELLRMRELYPDTVISHPYNIKTIVTGKSHWGTFGYDTCPSISVDHPAHVDRLANGHPILRDFNTYRADHTIQFCCTAGDCDSCRDSQAMSSWLLVNIHHFLDSTDQLRIWVEMAECFYRQYYWSPFHPKNPHYMRSSHASENFK
ncbi:hypothetical protein QFZ82_000123 [Streptomyces sp. V4I23]|uniref:radical SAM protein n=1 Tax=Streptomyces sp. V4I23 TaxID=3042282 RepID=UPI0027864C42|nr:radical SAM protein [Streptomyces sp. V4I23]MDQ1005639.1 hypothetical protein [Streptomyces sp. V4I23]